MSMKRNILVVGSVALGCALIPVLPPTLTNDPGTACLSFGPTSFTGVTLNIYWSSTADETTPSNAFRARLVTGSVTSSPKDTALLVWPVRDP